LQSPQLLRRRRVPRLIINLSTCHRRGVDGHGYKAGNFPTAAVAREEPLGGA
jgi:hypothetical protein